MKGRVLHQERDIMRNSETEREQHDRGCCQDQQSSLILMVSVGYYDFKGERQCHRTATHIHIDKEKQKNESGKKERARATLA